MNTFHVGQEVVCKIGGTWKWATQPCPPDLQPEKGRVYMIVGLEPSGIEQCACFLRLKEFPGNVVYGCNGFEPVVSPRTDISVFETLLIKSKQPELV